MSIGARKVYAMTAIGNDSVNAAIDLIEQQLESDDPAYVRRFESAQRVETAKAVIVAVLLVSGAVLLTVGLGTLSWAAWISGVIALVAAVVVDEGHKRSLRRRANHQPSVSS